MIDRPLARKPKLYFDTVAAPSHVTFDDGCELRRNFPWALYVGAWWEYKDPDVIKVEIGDWIVIVRGPNLSPLFQAIEEHALLRVCAHPELGEGETPFVDTFALEIRLFGPTAEPFGKVHPGQTEFKLHQ